MLGALLEVEMSKKCTTLWREAHFQVKTRKTSCSEHCWKLRCRKSARRGGPKHISKSKCTKHHARSTFGSEMSKKCTPLWREAHFYVKMPKRPHVRTTFGRSDVVSRGRRKGFCTVSKESTNGGVLWQLQLQPPIHYTTFHSTPLQLQLQHTTTE